MGDKGKLCIFHVQHIPGIIATQVKNIQSVLTSNGNTLIVSLWVK